MYQEGTDQYALGVVPMVRIDPSTARVKEADATGGGHTEKYHMYFVNTYSTSNAGT